MMEWQKLIITDINSLVTIHSKVGRMEQMFKRKYYGLSLCKSGEIIYKMNGKTFVSTKDNAVILPQGACYSIFGKKEGFFPVINFTCNNFDCKEITVLPLTNAQLCLNYFEALKNQMIGKQNNLLTMSLFYQLLNEIFASTTTNNNLIDSATKYINMNLSNEELSNKEIAEHLGISEVYLRKLFKNHLNTSPKQYILNLRIKKSKQFLTDTALSVTDISESCGFGSVYHFSRIFKQKVGFSPSQYAQENKIFKI